MMQTFKTKHDQLNGSGKYEPIKLPGVYKAIATGNFITEGGKEDYQYIEMKILALTLPVRPCYNDAWLPSKEWLAKYGKDIFFWVAFEGGNPRQPVVMGWCFKNGKQNGVDNFPDSRVRRMINIIEEFNDNDQSYTLTHSNGDVLRFDKNEYKATVQQWAAEVKGTYQVTAQRVVLDAMETIKLGANATDKAVLGDKLNVNLQELLSELHSTFAQLQAQFSTLSAVAAGNPQTAGMASGFTQAATALNIGGAKIQSIIAKLAQHLSPKTLVE